MTEDSVSFLPFQAFSSEEVALAKQRLVQLQTFQAQLDATWKGSRWVIDLVTRSRDKGSVSASIRALAQFDLQTSSESIVSADAVPRKSDEVQLLGLHSKSDQQLRFGGTLGTGSSLKFSRSENQLANIGMGSPSAANSPIEGLSARPSPSRHHLQSFLHEPLSGRKVSVPLQAIMGGGGPVPGSEKLQFNPKIYSTHSQSDSTISACASSPEPTISASLHNLYRHSSSSQIGGPIPSVVVSAESQPPEGGVPVKRRSHSPMPQPQVKGPGERSGEPPPVPPRRTLPPPPPPGPGPFPALDPPPIPTVEVNLCESTRSWSGSSTSGEGTGGALGNPSPVLGVIQVYAAYDCGLSPGTSVRLQINRSTTARTVVELVVRQLNSEVEAKGRSTPLYDRASDFVLVAVIGARERCLRPDFQPLQLQSPWKCGRLYVRKRADVTAALELNSKGDMTYL